jgi:hypothetical protein
MCFKKCKLISIDLGFGFWGYRHDREKLRNRPSLISSVLPSFYSLEYEINVQW